MLTYTEVAGLLKIVERKFGLVSVAICRRKSDIHMTNRCMAIPDCNKYFKFLHEMGHILFDLSAGDGGGIPDLFDQVAFLLGFSDIKDNIKKDELFADIFSAVSLNGAGYPEYKSFKFTFTDSLYDFLEDYFRMLVNSVNRNYYESDHYSKLLQ